ncbi:MAG TPA: hypothetical protein VH143_28645 [Kofleriaceae bacterium]|jgi:hypothetical protein|nr:hypothetical protein [Kofleriaceae bacterium]
MREAAIEAARKKDDEPLKVALEDDQEVKSPDRHVGGEIPPVRDGLADPEDQQSASELAFDNPELASSDVKEAVALLIVNNFGGDTKKAFEHYDRDEDDGLSQSELAGLLKDAGLGNEAERIAKTVIGEDQLAADYDATVNYDNFERAFAD